MPEWKDELRAALAHLHLDPGREESIVEELTQHLDEQYAELISNGMSEEQAYRSVLSGLDKQALGAALAPVFHPEPPPLPPVPHGSAGLFTDLGKDFRLAVRQLRRSPGFAIVAVLSLALGIGANTAIFELIDAVLLRTLPLPQPEALADVSLIHQGRSGSSPSRQHEFSSAIWEQFRLRQKAFQNVAAWSTERLDLGRGGEARLADGLWISGDFFNTLRVQPALGRLFSSSDDHGSCGIEGVVISHSLWRAEFGERPDILGSSLSLNGKLFPIIGVTQPNFSGLEVGRKFDVALPLCSEPVLHPEYNWSKTGTTWWLAVIGRLRSGWTLDRASAQLASVSPAIFAATVPAEYDAITRTSYLRFKCRATPAATGVSTLRNDYQHPLWLLLAISGVVLFIACLNIANLLLARASARRGEMALRMAVGASRLRLVRQLLIESLLLAVLGTVVGSLLARALTQILVSGISTGQDKIFLSLSLDWRLLSFTAGLALLTSLVFGIAPALHAARVEPGAVIKAGSLGMTAGRQNLSLRRVFTVSQVAFSLLLVVVALSFVRTFRNLVNLNVGFNQEHILVAGFDFSRLSLPMQSRHNYKRQLLEQIRAIPGVVSVARTSVLPLSGSWWNDRVDVPGTAIQRRHVNFSGLSSGYFRTLSIPMLAGRDFDDSDNLHSPLVAIVNEAFAKDFLGSVNSLGRIFGVRQDEGKPDKLYRVVGVVGNTRYGTLRDEFKPVSYLADTQDPEPDVDATMLIRSDQQVASLISSLKQVAAKNNPEIVLNFSILQNSIRETLGREHLVATLSAFYGALAAILSIIGLYGIMSYVVVRRSREIGIRVALGATGSRMLGMVLSDAVRMLGIGFVMGITLVIITSHAMQSLLYGVKPTDPMSLVLALAGMTAIALAACLIPARRAASIHPTDILRQE